MKKLLLSLCMALPILASAQVGDPETVTTRTPLDRTSWTATASSEETQGEGNNGYVIRPDNSKYNFLDNTLGTFWHSKWYGGNDALPHTIVVDMQSAQTISGVFITARQTNNEGRPKAIVIATSPDNATWTDQITTDAAGTAAQQNFDFTADVSGVRYVRLTINSTQGGQQSTALAEIGAYNKSVVTNVYSWNRTGWVITATDKDGNPDSYATQPTDYMKDANNSTYWEADWSKGAGYFPRTIKIDLGAVRQVNKFSYIQRNHYNSRVKTATISYSADDVTYTSMSTSTWEPNSNENAILIGHTENIRYIKILIDDSYGDASSVALAEFRAYYEQILPVALNGFQAKANNNGVSLTWNTSVEHNASHFNVLRSSDGKNFSKIGRVEAAGNSSSSKSYRYNDNSPLAGTNYYQLQQVDLDGSSTTSAVVSAQVSLAKASLEVKAINGGQVSLAVSGLAADKGVLTASNSLGQVIASQNVDFSKGVATLNVGTAKGLIIFTFTSAEGSLSKKLVK